MGQKGLLQFFENIGDYVIHTFKYYLDLFTFSVTCMFSIAHPKTYNPASRVIFVRQIYSTSLRLIPAFLILAVSLGTVFMGAIISVAISYSLEDHIGEILVKFALVELVPFLTALLVAVRIGSKTNSQIAIMETTNEIHTLEKYNINIIHYLVTPQILGGMLSFLFLVTTFAIVMTISGYVFLYFSINMEFCQYLRILIATATIKDVLLFVVKNLLFGFAIITIPCFNGLKAIKSYFAIADNVSKGQAELFKGLFFIEVILLVLHFV
jgi:phospholipid/cholesterol/gamma-HCH transport system permease protein